MEVIDLDPAVAKPEALQLMILSFSPQPDIARRFMAFTASAAGQAVFRKHGFIDNAGAVAR